MSDLHEETQISHPLAYSCAHGFVDKSRREDVFNFVAFGSESAITQAIAARRTFPEICSSMVDASWAAR